MAALKEYEHHIQHTHADRQGTAWCGEKVWGHDWVFQSLDHAAYAAPTSLLQPCPACVEAATRALLGERSP